MGRGKVDIVRGEVRRQQPSSRPTATAFSGERCADDCPHNELKKRHKKTEQTYLGCNTSSVILADSTSERRWRCCFFFLFFLSFFLL